jgi:surface protein
MLAVREKTRIKRFKEAWQEEQAAIDLASIMVGVIVIGIISGVIAAAIFAVIPWTQDNAAKAQLDSVRTAQNAYTGLSASGQVNPNVAKASYASLAGLQQQKLFKATSDTPLKVAVNSDSTCYTAVMQSKSGKYFWTDSYTNKTQLVDASTNSDCTDVNDLVLDKANGLFIATIDTTAAACKNYTLPVQGAVALKSINWGDGNKTQNYSATSSTTGAPHTYTQSGVQTITATGTFTQLGKLDSCVTAITTFANTNTTTLTYTFSNASNIKTIAEIPSTVKDLSFAFYFNHSFNDASITKWNVSNVTNMTDMFTYADTFNQDISSWNTGSVTNLDEMFFGSKAFNQPIGKWNVSKVQSFKNMFNQSQIFNQSLAAWDTSSATNMNGMFVFSRKFNQNLTGWNVNTVTDHGNFNAASDLTNANSPIWKN